MANISELTNLHAMAVFYSRKMNTLPPYLGETYFTPTKIATDMMSYLTQKQGAPVLAKANTYDGQPTPINRDSFSKEFFQTNFFRSASALNENDLEEINRALYNGDDQLVKSLIINLFDDKTKNLLGMRTRREWMAMQALMTGRVDLKSNGVSKSVEYLTDPDFVADASTDWTDTKASNPFEDLRKAITALKHKGITPNQVVMNDDTFRLIQNNEKIRETLYVGTGAGANVFLTENNVVNFIQSELHVTPVVYDQGFVDEEATGTNDFTPFVPTGKVVLLDAPIPAEFAKQGTVLGTSASSANVIGHMAFAPTPEELGMRNGRIAQNSVQLFDTGVAYHEYYNDKLVQTEDLVSMNCLPSFEGSQGVYRLTVAKDAESAPEGVSTEATKDGAQVTAKK